MQRADLLDVLARVQKAVASRPDAPAFGAAFFDGESAIAWDNELGITTPCELPVRGGISFELLSGWLKSAMSTELSVEPGSTSAVFRCGRSKLETELFPSDEMIWDRREGVGVEIQELSGFLRALEFVLPHVGHDVALPWTVGVTIDVDDGAELFATDNLTIGAARVLCDADGAVAARVSQRFCQALLALSKLANLIVLEVSDSWVRAIFDDDTVLVTRVGFEAKPYRYRELVETSIASLHESSVEITEELVRSVAAINGVLKIADEERCLLTCSDGSLTIAAAAGSVKAFETLPFDHPDFEVEVPSAEFLRSLKSGTVISVGAVVAIGGDDTVSLVSCYIE